MLKNGYAPTKNNYGTVVETLAINVKTLYRALAFLPPISTIKINTITTIACIHIAKAGIPCLFNLVTFSGQKSFGVPKTNDFNGE